MSPKGGFLNQSFYFKRSKPGNQKQAAKVQANSVIWTWNNDKKNKTRNSQGRYAGLLTQKTRQSGQEERNTVVKYTRER